VLIERHRRRRPRLAILKPGRRAADTCSVRRIAFPLVISLALAVPASAAEIHVSAYDQGAFDLFAPADVMLAQGDTIVFDFDGPSSHTATDGTGMDLYDSGVVPGGGPSFAYTYVAAGRYAFVCTLHAEMSGVARIPIVVRPSATAPGGTVRVRWATASAATGLVYDVQLRRPGGAWHPWRTAVTARKATFEPGKAGTFRFRARMRRPGAAAAGWSAAGAVTVGSGLRPS
jgi:plastocyanin